MDGKNTAVVGILTAVLAYGTVAVVHAGPPAEDGAVRQTDSRADKELTQRIRRSIAGDETISAQGKNVKILSLNGKVTLKGMVRTDVEKQQIGQKAASVVGPDNVVNALEITPAR